MSDVAKGIARIASPRTLGMMANRRFCVNWRRRQGAPNLLGPVGITPISPGGTTDRPSEGTTDNPLVGIPTHPQWVIPTHPQVVLPTTPKGVLPKTPRGSGVAGDYGRAFNRLGLKLKLEIGQGRHSSIFRVRFRCSMRGSFRVTPLQTGYASLPDGVGFPF